MNYTQKIDNSIDQFWDDDASVNAISFLLENENFRSFSDGLTELLCRSGYSGDVDSVDDKCAYLFSKLQELGSTVSKKTVKTWFSGSHRPGLSHDSRIKMYEICFSLNVTLPDVYWFFNHVYLDRCFNCHIINEAVYCFCLGKGIKYSRAQELIDIIDKTEAPLSDNDTMIINYTKFVKSQIMQFETEEELINFLVLQKDNYATWNTSAYFQISSLYKEIIGNSDSADIVSSLKLEVERKINSKNSGLKKNRIDTTGIDKCGLFVQEMIWDANHSCGSNTACDYLKEVLSGNSISNSFFLKELRIEPTKSFKHFNKNEFTDAICKNFPSAKVLSNVLDNVKVGLSESYDSIRKTLILFHFYKFWCNVKIEHPETKEYTLYELSDIYLEEINTCLGDAGYEDLFAGNPYDWIFLWASRDEQPLDAFRDLMYELMCSDEGTDM